MYKKSKSQDGDQELDSMIESNSDLATTQSEQPHIEIIWNI